MYLSKNIANSFPYFDHKQQLSCSVNKQKFFILPVEFVKKMGYIFFAVSSTFFFKDKSEGLKLKI